MKAAISAFNKYAGGYDRWFETHPAICHMDDVTAFAAAGFPGISPENELHGLCIQVVQK
jgi:hypothetical protein